MYIMIRNNIKYYPNYQIKFEDLDSQKLEIHGYLYTIFRDHKLSYTYDKFERDPQLPLL